MKRTKKDLRVVIWAFMLVACCGPSFAESEMPAMVIRTQYRNPSTQQWQNESVWNFRPQDGFQYGVYRNDDERPAMVLTYSPAGRLIGVHDRLSGTEGRDMGAQEAITLSWGFPVPFDDLDPKGPDQQEETIHKQVGEARFASQVTKETGSITYGEAVGQGMIGRPQQAVYHGGPLRLITVRQGQAILVRQLWETGAGWWLYEDTDTRRSWREF